jgi:hypothetical protein
VSAEIRFATSFTRWRITPAINPPCELPFLPRVELNPEISKLFEVRARQRLNPVAADFYDNLSHFQTRATLN